ncbi:2-Hydroxyacid oxidase 2-like [Toxorhynchites rutilus septentrionalis]|uniref:2-Hydroxyacid oxidase 2-like n=1 Tax=Toxorhynchites rutilus septentrionalis TaxID=329112 RepID=UPI00247A86CB|nr:2-Hydroxyacid oxidase 2-like [Toxorhynchites rutilus septentrionalis]
MPIGIGPIGLLKLAHCDGEKAMARAARTMGIPFVLSALSSVAIEDIAEAIPKTPKWFQLFIFKDRELTENLVRRAEKARFKAIVVTVDVPIVGMRRNEMKNPLTLPSKVTFANLCPPYHSVCTKNIMEYVKNQFDPTVGWDSLRWLLSITTLPVIVKGILTKEDAVIAAELGVHGIIVSNNGGRQLDSAPATIEALPEIAQAVGNRVTVMLDGGISQGTDVFKAVALGAKMVFLGRTAVWGLTVGGQIGVEDVLDLLRLELDSAMAMSGCKTPIHICENCVRFESELLRPRSRIPDNYNFDDDDKDDEVVVVDRRKSTVSEKLVDNNLVPTGEDGLAKDPKSGDGVDECGKNISPWCKTVNNETEPVRSPPRITREVRVVPEVAKVLQRNIKAEIIRRNQARNSEYRNRAHSMQTLISIKKPTGDCRCIL